MDSLDRTILLFSIICFLLFSGGLLILFILLLYIKSRIESLEQKIQLLLSGRNPPDSTTATTSPLPSPGKKNGPDTAARDPDARVSLRDSEENNGNREKQVIPTSCRGYETSSPFLLSRNQHPAKNAPGIFPRPAGASSRSTAGEVGTPPAAASPVSSAVLSDALSRSADSEEECRAQKIGTPPLPPGWEKKTGKDSRAADKETNEAEKKENHRANRILRKIWIWILAGEEPRSESVSMEYAVASTWLLRFSVLILLAGIGFFLKYSIQNDLIGEVGRVILSFAASSGLLIGAWRLNRTRYRMIASGLAGGAIAAFYFSCYAAGPMYHLLPGAPVFAMMCCVTLGACLLALRTDSLLMSILGTAGGYLTPILLSTGERNLTGLYSYMTLIGAGLFLLARKKHWHLLNALSLCFTCGIFGMSLRGYASGEFSVCFSFLTVFFLLFSFIPIHRHLSEREGITWIETLMLLVNVSFYFYFSWDLLGRRLEEGMSDLRWRALLTAALAAFYFLQGWIFSGKRFRSGNLLRSMMGLGFFFMTITIPILFTKEILVIFLSLQGLLLVWFSLRFRSRTVLGMALLLYLLLLPYVTGSGLIAFHKQLDPGNYWVDFLPRMLKFAFFCASLFGSAFLFSREGAPRREEECFPRNHSDGEDEKLFSEQPQGGILNRILKILSVLACVAGGIVLFWYLHLELAAFSDVLYPPMKESVLSLIWIAAILLVLLFPGRSPAGKIRTGIAVILLFLFCCKLLFADASAWEVDWSGMLFPGTSRGASFPEALMLRMADFLPYAILCGFVSRLLTRRGRKNLGLFCAFCGLGVLFCFSTWELSTALSLFVPGLRSGGISVLWGLFALGMLFSGIRGNSRTLRYAGLLLFLLTSFKIFFYDLESLSDMWRYFAFLLLGALTLGGAFLCVRFKDSFHTTAASSSSSAAAAAAAAAAADRGDSAEDRKNSAGKKA